MTFRKTLGPPVTIEQIKSRRARSSRQKGKRAEYQLRDYLRKCGWTAHRVALSGAWAGAKGDVKASKNGREVLLECKRHTSKWTKFWLLLNDSIKESKDDVISVCVPGMEKQLVDISYTLDGIYESSMMYPLAKHHPLYEKYGKTFNRLPIMYKYLGNADILVIKDKFKPFVFFRFR